MARHRDGHLDVAELMNRADAKRTAKGLSDEAVDHEDIFGLLERYIQRAAERARPRAPGVTPRRRKR